MKRARAGEDGESPSDAPTSNEEEDDVGPMPAPEGGAAPVSEPSSKRAKVVPFQQLYLDHLPDAQQYEQSYMHRDTVTHVCVMAKTDFVATGSADGVVKFWKKNAKGGIEFVKQYRAHLGSISGMSSSCDGLVLATVGTDNALKVFDVVSFDMINMTKLDFEPSTCEWVHRAGAAMTLVAVADRTSPVVRVFDGRGETAKAVAQVRVHAKPVTALRYNPAMDTVISIDSAGVIDYWSPGADYGFPEEQVDFSFKTDTDLFDLARNKAHTTDIGLSPDGTQFVLCATDQRVRVFRFRTGRLVCSIDESISVNEALQQQAQQHKQAGGDGSATEASHVQIDNLEFGRRAAIERDTARTGLLAMANALFDESALFILYPTILGIKVVNLATKKCIRVIGSNESGVRFLRIALYQSLPKTSHAASTVELLASDNPTINKAVLDPTLFATAFRKARFFMVTRREPGEAHTETGRDVFNEKPTREEQMAAVESSGHSVLADQATIHTTMGDITVKLFPSECPKTVENFAQHSRNGYYNGHLVHRCIKSFMVQMGDPNGDGSGGESIWGGEFVDEFHPSLRHDRPYTLSMANCGPNTNGSQFFITVVPTPWLDNKHTVFGRVIKGMDIAQAISEVRTNRSDKPWEDIKIVSISVR